MKKIYVLSLLLMSTLSFGQTFTGTYTFAGILASATNGTIDPTPPPTAVGVVFSSFSATNPGTPTTFTGSSGAGRFAYPNHPLGATNGDNVTFTGAIDTSMYYEVTITPNGGTTYNLSGITFGMRRSSTGPRNFAVRSSLDSYAANLPASISPVNANLNVQATNNFFWALDATSNTTDQLGSTITLGSSFTGLTTAVTFRFYGWNAEAFTGTFSVDNVAISGNVTTLGVKQNSISGLKFYPNPATTNLYITSDSNEPKDLLVVSVLGKVVLNTKVTNGPVNVSSLPSGVYMAKVTEAGKSVTRKLVIE